MKISYNWLKDYLPEDLVVSKMMDGPQMLSNILTSVGLEVESLEKFEEVKRSLALRFNSRESFNLRKTS